MSKGLAIVLGVAAVGGALYYFSREVGAEPPQEGDRRCNGTNLEEYQGGQWVVILENSPECGYEPPPYCNEGEQRCDGTILQECINNTWVAISDPDFICAPRPSDEINIHGYIRDSISMEPVNGTYVLINGIHASSQSDGLYWLYHQEWADSVTITVEAEGYEPYEITVSASGVMNVDIAMVALEPPEPPPPVMEFQLTRVGFTWVGLHLEYGTYNFSGDCVPVIGAGATFTSGGDGSVFSYASNVHVYFDRGISGQLSSKSEVTYPDGTIHTYRYNLDYADRYTGIKLGYIHFRQEGEYLWKVSVTSNGVPVAYNEFYIIGTKHPENCAQAIEDYYEEEHPPYPVWGEGSLEGIVTRGGYPQASALVGLGSGDSLKGYQFTYRATTNSSGYYKITGIKMNLVSQVPPYELTGTVSLVCAALKSGHFIKHVGVIEIQEGENFLDIEV